MIALNRSVPVPEIPSHSLDRSVLLAHAREARPKKQRASAAPATTTREPFLVVGDYRIEHVGLTDEYLDSYELRSNATGKLLQRWDGDQTWRLHDAKSDSDRDYNAFARRWMYELCRLLTLARIQSAHSRVYSDLIGEATYSLFNSSAMGAKPGPVGVLMVHDGLVLLVNRKRPLGTRAGVNLEHTSFSLYAFDWLDRQWGEVMQWYPTEGSVLPTRPRREFLAQHLVAEPIIHEIARHTYARRNGDCSAWLPPKYAHLIKHDKLGNSAYRGKVKA